MAGEEVHFVEGDMLCSGCFQSHTDGDLALSILRKIAADRESTIITEHGEATQNPGHFYSQAVIDSRWTDVTDEERGLLDRLRAEFEDSR